MFRETVRIGYGSITPVACRDFAATLETSLRLILSHLALRRLIPNAPPSDFGRPAEHGGSGGGEGRGER